MNLQEQAEADTKRAILFNRFLNNIHNGYFTDPIMRNLPDEPKKETK